MLLPLHRNVSVYPIIWSVTRNQKPLTNQDTHLRECALHLLRYLNNRADVRQHILWNDIFEIRNGTIDGTTGEIAIANQWKDHYSKFLNSSSNIADIEDVCNSFKNMCFNQGMHVSSATEVIELIQKISNGKAAGMDGLSGESLKYANHNSLSFII